MNRKFAIPSESDEVDMGDEDITLDSGSSTEDDLFKEVIHFDRNILIDICI